MRRRHHERDEWPGHRHRERGASEGLAGPRCLADLEIPPSQPPRPIWVPAYLEPEFRRVVGEGIEMPRDQFVVARRRLVAPPTGLRHTANLTQDAGELSPALLAPSWHSGWRRLCSGHGCSLLFG